MLKERLESDKERILSRLSSCDTFKDAQVVMEDALSRVMLAESDSEFSAELFTTAKAALPLMESFRDPEEEDESLKKERKALKKVDRRERGKRGFKGILILLFGVLLAVIPFVLLYLQKERPEDAFWIIMAILLLGGLAMILLGGRMLGLASLKARDASLSVSVRPDSTKLYHHLSVLVAVMDDQLERYKASQARAGADGAGGAEGAQSASAQKALLLESKQQKEELEAASELLETLYAAKQSGMETDEAAELLGQVKHLLYRRGIDTEDFTAENAAHFDRMPAQTEGTIRPALVKENKVLVKGLAGTAGKR